MNFTQVAPWQRCPPPSVHAVPVDWPAHWLAVPELELEADALELAELDAEDELAELALELAAPPVAPLEVLTPPCPPVPPPPVPEQTQAPSHPRGTSARLGPRQYRCRGSMRPACRRRPNRRRPIGHSR